MKKLSGSSAYREGRKVILSAAAAALAVSMMPAAAFADAQFDSNGDPVYTLPTKPMSIQQVKKDSEGNSYTVDTLSVCAASPPMQMPYYSILGINNTMKGRATYITTGSAQNGLFGSDANIAPDPYLYNYCASENGATVAADAMVNANATTTVTIDGTEYNMPRDIYMETNIIQSTADTKSGDYTYAEWVKLENKRPGRTKTTEYNPTFLKMSLENGGTYKMAESVYTMAEQADKIIEQSKGANGSYTYATRYAEGPNTWKVASKYEDIAKGSQYYLLSKLADGSIKQKKTVAVICGYDDETGNYAVRKLDIGTLSDGSKDVDTNRYAGRIAGAVSAIAKDMNDLGLTPAQAPYVGTVTDRNGTTSTLDESAYLNWYTPEQIVANADAVLITDAVESNASSYLAHDSEGHQRTVQTNAEGLTKAQAALRNSGKKAADICVNWPQTLFGVFYAQGCENIMLTFVSEAFLYPEYFDLTDMMAWWTKNVWHVTDASVQDMVDSTCYKVSLSTNQSKIGTISKNYESKIDAMINAGNSYYLDNYAKIDQLNDGNIKTHSMDMLKARTTMLKKQAIKVSPSTKTFKYAAVKKAKQSANIKLSGAKGKVSASLSNAAKKAKIKASVSGKTKVKVTIPKKCKKGTYKVAVKAASTTVYKMAAAKTITIKVK